ncbi:MAG: hypothetical protein CMJ18_21320 [Phycisphaeraceae bacterium]|nr:hypothetical protein [Phycisphaeraceae bacterium]
MKWIVRLLLVLVVVVIAAVVVATVYIDQIARAAVEEGGTYALGVTTKLDSMDVGLTSGSIDLGGLNIDNPEGFTAPYFLSLGRGRLDVSLGSLTESTVVVPELSLGNLKMSLERRGDTSNYTTLMENLKRFESKEKQPGGKQYVIRRLLIEDIDVQVDIQMLGQDLKRVPLRIDKIELVDVGSETEGGVLLAELYDVIFKALLQGVLKDAGGVLPALVSGELSKGLGQLDDIAAKLDIEVEKVVGDVTNKLQGGIDKSVGDATKQIEEGIGGAAQKLGEGLGGLLGGGKKDE